MIKELLLDPIISGRGYNPVNTIVLALLFYLLAVFLLGFLKKRQLPINKIVVKAIPFLFLGGVVRSLEDACLYPCQMPLKVFFVTPGIYLSIIFLFLALLFLERKLKRQIAYPAGWLLLIGNLLLVRVVNLDAVVLTVFFAGFFSVLFFGLARILHLKLLFQNFNMAIIMAHLFEAAATFVAVDYFGYVEQHVVGSFLISSLGTGAAMLLLKALAIPLVLYLAEGLEKEERVFVKLLVLALGLGPGIRNFVSLGMGV